MANFCPNCGSTLKPNASFCGVCGNQLAVAPVAEEKAVAAPEMPTMDALVPPTITDDMFAAAPEVKEVVSADSVETPTMDAVLPPETTPEPAPAVPVPTAQEEAMAASPTPVVEQTPVIDHSMYNVYNTPQAKPVAPTPAPTIANPQPTNFNNNYPNQQFNNMQNNVAPSKGGAPIIPIILIILILAVIAVDVFVIFPDKIFGKDDSSSSKSISMVVDAGDYTY